MAKGRYRGRAGTPTRAEDPPTLEELTAAREEMPYSDLVIAQAMQDPSADVRAFAQRAEQRGQRPPELTRMLGQRAEYNFPEAMEAIVPEERYQGEDWLSMTKKYMDMPPEERALRVGPGSELGWTTAGVEPGDAVEIMTRGRRKKRRAKKAAGKRKRKKR